ncbi:hypothetical protein HETIRDRAFT_164715 [Heterobasidion irregulare TC 32-1]|uniref:Uncharacterized protein n=1 Tax=Heterobasidion irregulare (strain TC 32-1) TaxID=747525 RepID=W4JNJ2_HETIT|nr:uncharacterized protein HETIRDRAFT_164715 [Heterobasidion irregulare TC 32-1]ETW75127.1 hypothetical protein HETIRDRAFT_164715 [Heterobasidion irregulare TC 32-1]
MYYSGKSVKRNLEPIKSLVDDGTILLKKRGKKPHALQFLKNSVVVWRFGHELHQMVSVLAPIAKALKCLKAIDSTPANVYLYWLAVMASFLNLFKKNNEDIELPLDVVEDIQHIVNRRYQEMIKGPGKLVYLAMFFLYPHMLCFSLFYQILH